MKTDAAIRHKLRQVLYRHLKHRIQENFQKLPHTCGHNGQPKTLSVPRMCLYGASSPASWNGKVCDASVPGGVEQARSCPFWKPLRTKDEIKAEFRSLVSKNRAAVATQYPDAAALLWVLEEDVAPDDFEQVDLEENPLIQLLPPTTSPLKGDEP